MLLSVISVLVAITTVKCGGSPAPSPFWGVPGPVLVYQRPIDAMVDVTNDLGVAVLQDYAYTRSNFAFSPYGVVSVLVVLYEGARGESARQIHNTLRLPWNRDITRIGFRDIHRHLRSYFSHEGYLSGLTLNKNHTSLKLEYRRVLRFYGYDIGMGPDHQFPPTTTKKPPTTPQPTTTTTITEEMVPSTTTEDIIPPTTTTQQTTTEDIIPPTTTTRRTTTEDIIPPTTTTRRTTTEDIIPPTTTTTKRPAEEDGLTVITLNIPRETTPRPVADLPDVEEPVMDEPHADEPMSTEPAADKPMTDEAAADEPMSDEPAVDEPMTDEPAANKPMSTEPAAGEPKTDEPAADEPMSDEPAANEPTSEEPATDNSPPSTTPVQDEEQTVMVELTPSAILADKSGEPTEMMKEMPDEAAQASTEAAELQQSAEETESPPQETAASTEAPKLPTEPMMDQPEESAAPTEAQTELPTMADQPEESAAPTEAQTELPTMADQPEESAAPTEAQTELPTMADQPEESATPTEAQTELPTMADQPEESATPTEAQTELPTMADQPEESAAPTEAQTEPSIIADQPDAPTEVPQDVPDTVLPTEPDAEIIVPTEESPDISTENEATDMVSTAEMTSTEVSEESMTESMSEVVETRVKLDVPIPLAFNQSRAAGKRIKRSLGGNEPLIVFPDISLQLQNGMYDSQVARGYELYTQLPKRPFLVDGVAEELVPVMSYTAMFPFAYIQRLHAQALEFPLDDERYKLLLLLPVERRGLRQLIYDLSSCPLREIYQALRPTRVQAIIPSFMVEGFVILTPTLQQLGIWDVFDPRRADLTGMSEDPDLYVRNIEQAVTVVIRNYVKILDIQTRTMAARASLERFVVSHPFLYFVMDTDTHVSLMAGKIVDPLNSRIY